jgi:hypothetical protein
MLYAIKDPKRSIRLVYELLVPILLASRATAVIHDTGIVNIFHIEVIENPTFSTQLPVLSKFLKLGRKLQQSVHSHK